MKIPANRMHLMCGAAGLVLLLGAEELHAADAPSGIEEVIVTASRREERLQSVPLTATSIGSEALQRGNITSVRELQQLAPSVQILPSLTPQQNRVAIRGQVQQDGTNIALDPSIAFYIDDIYIARSGAGGQGLFDLERVEVLEGPQGSLFGRNTTGGAIKLITKKPEMDAFDGHIGGGYQGGDNKWTVNGVVNLPIVKDKVALRIAAQAYESEGFATNTLTGKGIDFAEAQTVRAGLSVQASDNFHILFQGDYEHSVIGAGNYVQFPQDVVGIATTITSANLAATAGAAAQQAIYQHITEVALEMGMPTNCIVVSAAGKLPTASAACPDPAAYLQAAQTALLAAATAMRNDPFNHAVNFTDTHNMTGLGGGIDPRNPSQLGGGALTLTYDLDFMTIRSITGFRGATLRSSYDLDATQFQIQPSNATNYARQISQELLLNGTLWNDRFDWTVGGYFFNERNHLTSKNFFYHRLSQIPDFGTTVGTQGLFNNLDAHNMSHAAFGQFTANVWRGLKLTLGLRNTWDKRSIGGANWVLFTDGSSGCALPLSARNTFPCRQVLKAAFDETTYNAAIQYEFDNDRQVYVRTARGYRSGGFSARLPSAGNTFDSEIVTDYEAGFKGSWFDNRLLTNVSAYASYRSNIQQGTLVRFPVSASDSSGGVHTITAATSNAFNIGDAKVYGTVLQLIARPVDWLSLTGNWLHTGSHFNSPSLPWDNLPLLPKNIVTASAEVTLPSFVEWLEAVYRIDVSYRSDMVDPSPNPLAFTNPLTAGKGSLVRYGDQTLVNMSLTFTLPRNIETSVYVKNAFDEEHYGQIFLTGSQVSRYMGNPRAIGFTVKVPFGESAEE